MSSLIDHFVQTWRRNPEHPALMFEDRRWSCAELDGETNRLANGLIRLGIQKGDRVALFLPNSAACLICQLAVFKAGAICVPVGAALSARELKQILNSAQPTALFTTPSRLPLVPRDLPFLNHLFTDIANEEGKPTLEQLQAEATPPQGRNTGDDENVMVLYTSGTTGVPKGVMYSNRNLVTSMLTFAENMTIRAEDRVVCFLPMSHAFALNGVLWICLFAGATTLILPEFEPKRVLRIVAKERISLFFGVPTHYALLVDLATRADLASVRHYYNCAAYLPVPLSRRWLERLGKPIQQGYGLTECGMVTFTQREGFKHGSVGKPTGTSQLRVVDPDSGRELKAGERGELMVCGPNVTHGYWQKPEQSAAAFREGWYRTGDIGFMDEDGFFFVLDRLKLVIHTGGYKVVPAEVEQVVLSLPGIQEAAAFGMPDEILGERVTLAVVLAPEAAVGSGEILALCRANLSPYKIPGEVLFVAEIPKNALGKTQKHRLREQTVQETAEACTNPAKAEPGDPGPMIAMLTTWLAEHLSLEAAELDLDEPFPELGMSSVSGLAMVRDLNERLTLALAPVTPWHYPTIRQLATHLAGLEGRSPSRERRAETRQSLPIAVIGAACAFPGGVRDLASFWSLLAGGESGIGELPPGRWPSDLYYDTDPEAEGKMYTLAGGFLQHIEDFDAAFFGMSPQEAGHSDPQHRLLMELIWHCLEDAYVPAGALKGGNTGLFLGVYSDEYAARGGEVDETWLPRQLRAMAVNRIASFLDVHGPAWVVDGSCSSGLLAVSQAMQCLRDGSCPQALAGAASLMLGPEVGISLCRLKMLAPDGRCKAFDARADGYVRGEGAAVVLLKPLPEALAAGNRIHGILRHASVNHDGRGSGLTAPNLAAQIDLLNGARAAADGETVDYVEAHGTGTKLGDPIELTALANAYCPGRSPQRPLYVGSVKANIGHLEAAAGLAGLLKVILFLKHEVICPQAHFETPNPHFAWSQYPLHIPKTTIPWPRTSHPRLAGVSAFGLTGTNVHLLVEEAPLPGPRESGRAPTLLTLSAKTPSALHELARRYQTLLDGVPAADLPELCTRAFLGRTHFVHRLAVVAQTPLLMRARLEAFQAAEAGTTRGDGWVYGRVDEAIPAGERGLPTADRRDDPARLAEEYVRGVALTWPDPGFPFGAEPALPLYPFERRRFFLEWPVGKHGRSPVVSGVTARVERLSADFVANALITLGFSWVVGRRFSLSQLIEETEISRREPLLKRLLAMLTEQGLLRRSDDSWRVVAPSTEQDPAVSCHRLKADFPKVRHELEMLARFGAGLSDLLSDRAEPLALLIPDGDFAPVRAIYRESPAAQAGNRRLLEVVKASWDFTEPPRVLEVGAGTGGTTAMLLPQLGRQTAAYVFSDVSPVFLAGARKEFAAYPLEYRRLDIEHDPTGQGFEPGSFQLIIATNVLHTAADLSSSLTFLRALLCPGGSLLLLETTARRGWVDLTFGMLSGWWTFNDRRAEHPLLDREGWLQILEETGFSPQAYSVDESADGCDLFPQTVFQARRPLHHIATKTTVSGRVDGAAITAPQGETAGHDQGAVLAFLTTYAGEVLCTPPQGLDPKAGLLALGADSLVLLSLRAKIRKVYGLELGLGLLSSLSLLELSARITRPDQQDPVEAPAGSGLFDAEAAARMMDHKLAALEARLERRFQALASAVTPSKNIQAPQSVPLTTKKPDPFAHLNPLQKQHFEALKERHLQRTAGSREKAQQGLEALADVRRLGAYYPSLREVAYPIYTRAAQGCRMTDVDGNEYIDLTMGFGAHFFGYHPDFLEAALRDGLRDRFSLGLVDERAQLVAQRLTALTGMARCAFFGSGTEAVMSAVRLARTSTGRHGIVVFAGSYHGQFDGVLAAAPDTGVQGRPAYPGIPAEALAHTLVLAYDDPASLAVIAERAHELAAVLVEPVQTLRPGPPPRAFLAQLRALTRERGIALIFDEVVTGFRCHPAGMQGLLGIRADLAVYGKILSAGMPLGVVAGAARYLNGLDGGTWGYTHPGEPQAVVTYCGGTFDKHPLTMVAASAVLDHLSAQGTGPMEALNRRTAAFAQDLNGFFEREGVPIRVEYFSSFFRFRHGPGLELLYLHLLEQGVHIWEGRRCFLSTAHDEAALTGVAQAVKASVTALRLGGFFPEGQPQDPPPAGAPIPERVPRTPRERPPVPTGPLRFSLAFFGRDRPEYEHLIACARFADRRQFEAIWLPERHFHELGGFSPNPGLLCAALARETSGLHLRAGSLVLPLHHPLRVVEDWSMLDHLSGGRVGLAIGSGWHARDFALAPERYADRHAWTMAAVADLQNLWRKGRMDVTNGLGEADEVAVFPRPLQAELPLWLSALGNPDTFARAGDLGLGVLTILIGQTPEQLAENIALYRTHLAAAGFPPEQARVTLYLHTYLAEDQEAAVAEARAPFLSYLKTFLSLRGEIFEGDQERLLENAYRRYVQTASLIGNPASCLPLIHRFQAMGIDEIACLVDFGLPPQRVLAGLAFLAELKKNSAAPNRSQPLTATQKQYLALAGLGDRGLLAYQDFTAFRLHGRLDVDRLESAVEKVVSRHELLRFAAASDGETGLVSAYPVIRLVLHELGGLRDPEAGFQAWLHALVARPLNLEQAPMFRFHLVRLSRQYHVLVLVSHQLTMDGASMFGLLKQVSQIYQVGEAPPAPVFADWERRRRARSKALLPYWRKDPAASVDRAVFPTDKKRPPLKTYTSKRLRFELDPELSEGVRSFCRTHGITPFSLYLSAYAILLRRLGNGPKMVIGIYADGREGGTDRQLIGPCLNLLPLVLSVPSRGGLVDFCVLVAQQLLGALEHAACSFAEILAESEMTRDPSETPLLATAFNHEHLPQSPLFGMETVYQPTPICAHPFDLSVHVMVEQLGTVLVWDYNSDLYTGAQIQRFCRYYGRVLSRCLAPEAGCLSGLSLLSDQEKRRISAEMDCRANTPQAAPVHQQFMALAARFPQAPALVAGAQRLNHGRLCERVACLAMTLRARGIRRQSRVAVLAERGIFAVEALLGTLVAGGTFIVLDPSQPPKRLLATLTDLEPELLLCERPLPGAPCPMLGIDHDPACRQARPVTIDPQMAAYVVLTSGSTGKPKGIVMAHAALSGYLASMVEALAPPAGIRYALVSTLSADLSFTQLFLPLITGSCLHLIDETCARDPERLAVYMETHAIDFLQIVPTHLAACMEIEQPRRLLPRKYLVLTGEPLPAPLGKRLLALAPALPIYNAYGPAEACVHAGLERLDPRVIQAVGDVPLGRPLGGYGIFLLDEALQPVPSGVAAQIYLGGVGLARGYSGDPRQTAARFIPDPFGRDAGARLYATGDRARRQKGVLQYLGRTDSQVKVRGYRVELGEIEAALRGLPGVDEAIAAANQEGSTRLVAFVQGSALEADLLRELRAVLPAYMVPGIVHVSAQLPRHPSGKLDRRALGRITLERPALDRPDRAQPPRSEHELLLARVWAEVLGREAVGVSTSFFELGGDSVTAMVVVARLRKLGCSLTTLQLFTTPTIAELAVHCRPTVAVAQVPPPQTLGLSPLNKALLHHSRVHPGMPVYLNSFLFHMDLPFDSDRFQRAWRATAVHHPMLWARFPDDATLVIDSRELLWRLEDWSNLSEKERKDRLTALVQEERVRPFDLERGPLMRLCLIEGGDRLIWIWSFHHLIIDGWSCALLLDEVWGRYLNDAFVPPPDQGADAFPRWLARQDSEAAKTYWRAHLKGVTRPTPLPGAAAPLGTPVYGLLKHSLAQPLSNALQAAARKHGLTPYSFVLGAWSLLLAAYQGCDEVVLGVVHANRPESLSGAQQLIGGFAVGLPLRVVLAGRSSLSWLRDLQLDHIQQAAHAHTDPELIRSCCEIAGDQPLFETLLAYANHPALLAEQGSISLVESYQSTHCPLLLTVIPGVSFQYRFTYDKTRLQQGDLERLGRQWLTLLSAMVENPSQPLRALVGLLFRPEPTIRRELEAEQWLPRRIRRQAAERLALVAPDGPLSYGALQQEVTSLAGCLRARGVAGERGVALLLPAGRQLVGALLAVHEAGGYFTCLDVGGPRARLLRILAEMAPTLVLCNNETLSLGGNTVPILNLDKPCESRATVRSEVSFDQAAYLVYSSGSTGTPKGAILSHRTLTNLVSQQLKEAQPLRTLQFAAPSFDVFCQEVMVTLAGGGTLVIPPAEVREDPLRLWAFIREEAITCLYLPLGVLRELATVALDGNLPAPALSALYVAGEAFVLDEVLRAFFALHPGCNVTNHYGPCEAHVVTRYSGPLALGPVPIGRPIDNLEAYVLDERGRPLPPGARGELYLGGLGLGRGYLRSPARTARAFVPHPFAGGRRLYRTGDLARTLPDGNLLFLGRRDRQLKVRGIRVEPGEIEQVLLGHPLIREACVIPRARPAGAVLCAFLVADLEPETAQAQVLSWSRARLPEAMIPSTFHFLARLPRNPHGKVDMGALPMAPAATASLRVANPILPLVLQAVRRVLRLAPETQMGPLDSFFGLGGHSLSAARLAADLSDRLGVALTAVDVFQNPTMEALATAAEQARSRGALPMPELRSHVPEGSFPLAPAQQRIWLMEQVEGPFAVFHLSFAWHMEGAFCPQSLNEALRLLAQRHAILRTVYGETNGEIHQQIMPQPQAMGHLVDLSGLAGSEQRVLPLQEAEAVRPFDLGRAPVLRVGLFRLAPQRHLLRLTVHHIACDGWSLEVLFTELAGLYAELVRGKQPKPAPLAFQYVDFALRQRETRAPMDPSYRAGLDGAEAPALPTRLFQAPRPSWRGGAVAVQLEATLCRDVRALAAARETTPYMVLQAAWLLLLQRYSGQRRMLLGCPMDLRRHGGLTSLIGCFVEVVAVPVDLGCNRFIDLLQRVQAADLTAFGCRGVPDAEAEGRQNLLRPTPVVFNWMEREPQPLCLEGLSLEPVPDSITSSKWDLGLYLAGDGEKISGRLIYRTDLFEADLVQGMGERFRRLLRQLVDRPLAALHDIPTDAAARLSLLRSFQGREAAVTALPIHQRIRQWAERDPAALALFGEDWRITRGELEERVQRVAAGLLKAGVVLGDLLVLLLTRGPDLVTGMLAASRVGATFVACDPAWPAGRLRHLKQTLSAGLALVETSPLVEAPASTCLPITALLADPVVDTPLNRPWSADFPLYISLTSGSGGAPKGVVTCERAVVNYLDDLVRRFALVPEDRFLQLAAPPFDAAVRDQWGPLTAGGALFFPDADQARDGRVLAQLAEKHQLTCITGLVPSLLLALATGGSGSVPTMRLLLLSGEPVHEEHLRAAARWLGPQTRVVNQYGPTETTMTATAKVLDLEKGAPFSIGLPIDNVNLYLTRAGEPVPEGVDGEVHIGGAGLAQGYHQQPGLTAARFLPDPFGGGGARLFRTGDLARFIPGVGLVFRGRVDAQLKVRGYRLDPAEVAAVLGRAAGVRRAFVTARAFGPNDTRLIAHLEARSKRAEQGCLDLDQIRHFCRDQLPRQLVPAYFHVWSSLPTRANGKLDRVAMARVRLVGADQGQTRPRTAMERLTARIWTEILGCGSCGAEAHFFDLGGDSLLAIRVCAALRAELGFVVPPGRLFDHPVLSDFAAFLASGREEGRSLPPIRALDGDGAAVLSPAQQPLWFLYQLQGSDPAYHLSDGFVLQGPLCCATLARVLAALYRRHPSLRTRYRGRGDQATPTLLDAAGFSLTCVDVGPLAPQRVGAIVDGFVGRAFVLEQGPPSRFLLLRVSAREHHLLACFHHLACDAGSVAILREELGRLYDAYLGGSDVRLPDPGPRYTDYAAWHQALVDHPEQARRRAFWMRELAGVRDEPLCLGRGGASHRRAWTFRLDEPTSRGLTALAKSHDASLFMVFLSAWSILLMRVSGRRELVVGTAVSNRETPGLARVVGLFVNTLLLRIHPTGPMFFPTMLGLVRTRVLAALANRDFPFQNVIQALQPKREGLPFLHNMLLFHNDPEVTPALTGVEVTRLSGERKVPKYALALIVTKSGGQLSVRLEINGAGVDPETALQLRDRLRDGLVALAAGESDPFLISPTQVSLPEAPHRDPVLSPSPQAGGVVGSIEAILAFHWRAVLGLERIAPDADFFQLGGHSLLVARLRERLEVALDREIPMALLYGGGFREQLRLLAEGAPGERGLIRLREGNDQPPLFLFPPIAGSSSCYRSLVEQLPPGRAIYGLEAPGLEPGETPLQRIESLAELYVRRLLARWSGPWLLAGWSMGGLIAYEAAQQLKARGAQVDLLVQWDSRVGGGSPADPWSVAGVLAQSLGFTLGPPPTTEGVEAGFLGEATRAGLLQEPTDESFLRDRLRLFLAHAAAMDYYRPKPYKGTLVYFRAAESERHRAWSTLAEDCHCYSSPASHEGMLTGTGARRLAERLQPLLAPSPVRENP